MPKPKGNKTQANERFLKSLEDPAKAFEFSKHLLESPTIQPKSGSRRKVGTKQKRHPGIGIYKREPLPGCALSSSDKIRDVVSKRYAGFADSEIEKLLGLSTKYIWQLEVRHPEAFAIAEQELVKNAVAKYENNVAMSRAELSEIGIKAVKTLSKVMDDAESRPQVRLRAAETVLKLLMGGTPTEKTTINIAALGGVVEKFNHAQRLSPSYIHDVQDAEVEVEEVDQGV